MKGFSSNRLKRVAKLGTALAKATSHLAKDSLSGFKKNLNETKDLSQQIIAAQKLIKSMGEMKGGLMKIGQMISITEDLFFPKEITQLFKVLQKSSPSMSQTQIDEIFLQSFGKKPQTLFKHFNYHPHAAASIGQVHKAQLESGEEVAVKIQYPDILKAIQGDLKSLDQLDKLFSLFTKNKPKLDIYIQEIKENLIDECDYEKEINNQILFKKTLSESFPSLYVPKAYKELSNKQILTSEFCEGDSFEQTLNYTQEQKDSLGQTMHDSHLYMLFGHGKLHADPQNGNYLFNQNKIILLDFGCVKSFSEQFLAAYIHLLIAVEKDDFNLYREAAKKLKILDPKDSIEMQEKHYRLIQNIYKPYTRKGSYHVEDLNPLNLIKDFLQTLQVDFKSREAPMREFVLLDRANLGLFTKLMGWKSRVDWTEGRQQYRDTYLDKYAPLFKNN